MKTTDVSKEGNNVPYLLIWGSGHLVLFKKKKKEKKRKSEGSSTQNYELEKEHKNATKKLVITN